MFATRNHLSVRIRTRAISPLNAADLFSGIARAANRYLWFPEVHLHGTR